MKRVPGNEYVWTFIAVYVVFYRLCVKQIYMLLVTLCIKLSMYQLRLLLVTDMIYCDLTRNEVSTFWTKCQIILITLSRTQLQNISLIIREIEKSRYGMNEITYDQSNNPTISFHDDLILRY